MKLEIFGNKKIEIKEFDFSGIVGKVLSNVIIKPDCGYSGFDLSLIKNEQHPIAI